MKKALIIAVTTAAVFFFSGCGQEMNFTVYNCGVNVSNPDEWLHVIMEWEDGGNASFYPQTRALTEADIDSLNSFSFTVKENKVVKITGGGFSEKEDAAGTTTLVAVDIGVNTRLVYGGFLETPQWYCAIYEDACFIYKK